MAGSWERITHGSEQKCDVLSNLDSCIVAFEPVVVVYTTLSVHF